MASTQRHSLRPPAYPEFKDAFSEVNGMHSAESRVMPSATSLSVVFP